MGRPPSRTTRQRQTFDQRGAEALSRRPFAFEKYEATRETCFLVEDRGVGRDSLGDLGNGPSDANASRPIIEMDVLGSKETSSKPGPTYFYGTPMVSDRRPTRRACRRTAGGRGAFDRLVAALPVDGRHRLNYGVFRVDLGHGA